MTGPQLGRRVYFQLLSQRVHLQQLRVLDVLVTDTVWLGIGATSAVEGRWLVGQRRRRTVIEHEWTLNGVHSCPSWPKWCPV